MPMKAIVIKSPGGPEVLEIMEVTKPEIQQGFVLMKNKAFGINRAEIFTRRGESPGVEFPRIPGIECVGVVEESGSKYFKKGQQIATLMGGMGRFFDGSYAEYTIVPEMQVFSFESDLEWETIAAVPEMFQTAYGALNFSLQIDQGETLLIRGGTSSVGLLAAQLAMLHGLDVISTTRHASKFGVLQQYGVNNVMLDDGEIAPKVRSTYPDGVDKLLDLTGTEVLRDSLNCVKRNGTLCLAGILSGKWLLENFSPMFEIPTAVHLTSYVGDYTNLDSLSLQNALNMVHSKELNLPLSEVFDFENIRSAHELMESNQANGKIVVRVNSNLSSYGKKS